MAKNVGNRMSRILALLGTILVWLPIALTLLTAAIGSIGRRSFHMDYLMPGELFPSAFLGALLLVWAAFRAGKRRRSVALGAAIMAAFFACVIVIPMFTGLSSGTTPPEGWPWALTLLSLALYSVAMIWTGVAGALLVRDLFHIGGGDPAPLTK